MVHKKQQSWQTHPPKKQEHCGDINDPASLGRHLKDWNGTAFYLGIAVISRDVLMSQNQQEEMTSRKAKRIHL